MRNNWGRTILAGRCACGSADAHRLTCRVSDALTRRGFTAGMAASVTSLGLPDMAAAQSSPPPPAADRPVLLRNIRLFDGVGLGLRDGVQVLVRGAQVEAILEGAAAPPDGARVIDGGGRVLMPGLIDVHWHALLAAIPQLAAMTADIAYLHLAAAAEAEKTLLRGFTTVRDAGGPSFALKRAIDEGLIVGPRIFPSGAMISQTAGHGDFRYRYEVPRGARLSYSEEVGAAAIADSPDEVRRRTREQLMLGASQVKVMAGGGVASLYDPLDATQFTLPELRAAVEAAEDWGTYVMVHVYMPAGIRRAIEAGVRCIEHGQLTDADTTRLMADRGVWWSLQPLMIGATPYPDAERREQLRMVTEGNDAAYEMAKRFGVKTGWGSDILFDPRSTARQSARFAALTRWYTPAQALRMATADNAELLALSGARGPYRHRLGRIEAGAYADMLLVEGNPLESLALFEDPAANLRLIMKDGRIHKNTLG